MKLSLLSRYGQQGASSRMRLFQYGHYLAAYGLQAETQAFFEDRYLLELYGNRSTFVSTIRAYVRRLVGLRKTYDSDALWIEKEVLPWLPWWFERLVICRTMPFAVDFDDAVFHNYDRHRLRIVRHILGQKIDRIMSASTLVMAGNQYLADRAQRAGASWVEVVPTVVDLDVYRVPADRRREPASTIGWIGTPSTWREYMVPLIPMLSAVAKQGKARILAVGGQQELADDRYVEHVAWSEESEVFRIQEMDIGIMPLTDTPWARGKCGYKLIQYMACALPVVASPVGANASLVEHGVNGFLAETEAEWRDALSRLLEDADLRRKMGEAGRRKVENEYSLQVWGPRVAKLLQTVAEKGRACSI